MSYQPEPVARIIRKGIIESIHYGSVAVVSADGRLLYRIGDPYFVTYLRSSAKPFQAIPVVESGAAREFGFTSAEIAIMAGSHSGDDLHVRTIQSILDKISLGPEHIRCGSHPPSTIGYRSHQRIRGRNGRFCTIIAPESTPGCWRWRCLRIYLWMTIFRLLIRFSRL